MTSAELQLPNPAAFGDQTDATHHPLIIALHWLTLAALVLGIAAIFVREAVEGRGLRLELLTLHRSIGLLVLFAAGVRLVLRKQFGQPAAAHATPPLLRRAAALSHGVLYLLLLALPLLGWAMTNAHGQTASIFGVLPLPALTAHDSDFADTLAEWHMWASWSLLAMVVVHAAAALWHHFVRRDPVLRSMLPKRRAAR